MKLTREQVQHIALLARVGLTDAEEQRFSAQLSAVLDYFETLQQVDTASVLPTTQTVDLNSTYRQDVSQPSSPEGEILANSPLREGNAFKVRAVLEE